MLFNGVNDSLGTLHNLVPNNLGAIFHFLDDCRYRIIRCRHRLLRNTIHNGFDLPSILGSELFCNGRCLIDDNLFSLSSD
jgi:hypothetical protein